LLAIRSQENEGKLSRQHRLNRPKRLIKKKLCYRNSEQQQQYCAPKVGGLLAASVLGNDRIVDDVPLREIRRGVQCILQSMDETFQDFPTLEARGHVCKEFWLTMFIWEICCLHFFI